MTKISKLFVGIFLLLPIFIKDVSASSTSKNSANLTIFCEPNMVNALTAVGRSYSGNKNIVVSIIFDSSFELIRNVDFGEPDDIFISSHPYWIENLKRKGLVDVYNLANIAKDQLILVTSDKNQKINGDLIKDSDDIREIVKKISNEKIPLVIGSNHTSLGLYTEELIKNIDIKKHYLYRKAGEDKKSIIDFLNENPEYYGIILASEIQDTSNIRILKIIPDKNIYYQGLVIAGGNMEKARDFLKYLGSEEAKEILVNNGFIVE